MAGNVRPHNCKFGRKDVCSLHYYRRSSTGNRLNILISSVYSLANDWQTFAAWYSIYRNLPDAEVQVMCARDLPTNPAFEWPYRCGVNFFQHKNVGKKIGCPYLNKLYASYIALKEDFVQQPLMVIDADVMAVRSFSKETLDSLNDPSVNYALSHPVWFFKELSLERAADTLNRYNEHIEGDRPDSQKVRLMLRDVLGEPDAVPDLCCDVNMPGQCAFVHCNKVIGRYNKMEWERTRSFPPFSFTSEISKTGLNSANERLVVKLWERMQKVYNAVQ